MLLTRDEMRFDFDGARFELPRDRESLGFVFSQFLYGEVTGIQVGHWIHHAPDLQSARFLAVQCGQELAHVRLMAQILGHLGVPPQPANRWVKFLATGLMGSGWDEHCCLEMALGEGYVLAILYALEDTIPDAEIVGLLRTASREEEMHVQFGEMQTQRAAAADPRLRRRLLGMSLVSLLGMRRLSIALRRHADPAHPVWRQVPALADHLAALTELRLQRLGLLDQPLSTMPAARRVGLIAEGLGWRGLALVPRRRRLLTDTYLDDPAIQKAASRPIPGPARPRHDIDRDPVT